jgi:hypothetical protein
LGVRVKTKPSTFEAAMQTGRPGDEEERETFMRRDET